MEQTAIRFRTARKLWMRLASLAEASKNSTDTKSASDDRSCRSPAPTSVPCVPCSTVTPSAQDRTARPMRRRFPCIRNVADWHPRKSGLVDAANRNPSMWKQSQHALHAAAPPHPARHPVHPACWPEGARVRRRVPDSLRPVISSANEGERGETSALRVRRSRSPHALSSSEPQHTPRGNRLQYEGPKTAASYTIFASALHCIRGSFGNIACWLATSSFAWPSQADRAPPAADRL